MKVAELVKMLDLASVKMDSTVQDVKDCIAFAKEWNIPQVCFNNANIPVAKKIMEEEGITDIALMGTAAFPTGCFPTEIKLAEIEFCARNGCKEIDICSNQGFLKSNMFDEFEADIVACVKAAHEAGLVIKIIVEAASITPEQLKKSCEIVARAGADFYKTSSGYMENKTLPIHIATIRTFVEGKCEIKAANGVRSFAQLMALYNEGCTRFGVGLPFVRDIVADCKAQEN